MQITERRTLLKLEQEKMKMPKQTKSNTTTGSKKIWIELPPAISPEDGKDNCTKANAMLRRLTKPEHLINGRLPHEFSWGEDGYRFGGDMGDSLLNDRGVWLNLDYLGR
jgi:hypothetical protein